MSKVWFLVIGVILLIVWFGEDRSFYTTGNGKYVTVWKTYGNTCYVIPGKYYGLTKPSKRTHIQSTNTAMISLLWNERLDTIFMSSSKATVFNFPSSEVFILDYEANSKAVDNIYTYLEDNKRKVKKNAQYISLMIEENYATDQNGKKL